MTNNAVHLLVESDSTQAQDKSAPAPRRASSGAEQPRGAGEESIAISIVSHSRLLREGLITLIGRHIMVHLVGDYSEHSEPREGLPNPPHHVVLLDSGVGEERASAWTRWWRSRSMPPAILVLEVENNKDVILACIESGANGYTLKEASPSDVARAIERASNGQALCSPEVTAHLFARLAALKGMQSAPVEPRVPLTARELEVVRCIAQGLSNKEIAVALCIEVHTVKHHVHNVLEKLQVGHRRDAARYAFEQGWIGAPL